MTDTPPVNRQIKDGVFRLLFESPQNAAELYYALTGDRCSPDEIEIITITTVVSGRMKNDLAFLVRGRILVIGEHMASPCMNIPIRLLMYTGALYEKIIKIKGEGEFLYRSKLYKIPTPEFVVFYNGVDKRPEKEILYLSSSFETTADKHLGTMELEVPVYNINKGMNTELFKKSPKLKQYAEFVSKLREYMALYNDDKRAVRETVNYCIAHDVLHEFFREQGGRIVSILSAEFDIDVAKRVWKEEGIEEGQARAAFMFIKNGFTFENVIKILNLSHNEIELLEEMLTNAD